MAHTSSASGTNPHQLVPKTADAHSVRVRVRIHALYGVPPGRDHIEHQLLVLLKLPHGRQLSLLAGHCCAPPSAVVIIFVDFLGAGGRGPCLCAGGGTFTTLAAAPLPNGCKYDTAFPCLVFWLVGNLTAAPQKAGE
jgi:hypothetical protein